MDKEYPVPLYYRIYADLKEKIAEGVFKPGDRIPSEKELCKIYGVSRLTIRRALEELRREGIIERTKKRYFHNGIKEGRTTDRAKRVHR